MNSALCQAKLNDCTGAVDSLRQAAEQARIRDVYNSADKHTCLIFKGISNGAIIHNETKNYSAMQLEEMNHSAFDSFRNDESFSEITENLRKHAKTW